MYAKAKTKRKPKSCLIWRAQVGADYGARLRIFPPWRQQGGTRQAPCFYLKGGSDR